MNKATWTLGGALIGALTFSAFQSRLTDVLTVDGLPLPDAQIIAEEIRNGAAVAQLAVNITEPIARSDLLSQGLGLVSAQTHAYAVMGLISATITLIAAVLMVLYLRRIRATADGDPGRRIRP